MYTKLEIILERKKIFCSENFLDFQSADGEEILIYVLEAKTGILCWEYVTVIYWLVEGWRRGI